MKKLFTVHYTTANYNQFKTYAQNANKHTQSKTFINDFEKAVEFAKTVNGNIYYLGKKIAF